MKTKFFSNRYYTCFFLLLSVMIINTLVGCSSEDIIKPKENIKFGIYLLEDQSITWESLKTRNLDSLKLKEWLTEDKIDFYDYSSHVIYLNVDYNTLLSFPHNDNTPFVVVANNKICYYGCFGPPKDTTQPHVVFTPLDLCTDLVMLEFNPPQRKDIRVNDEIKAALTDAGKIKLGIKFYIYDINYFEYGNSTYNHLFLIEKYDCYNYENKNIYTPNINHYIIKVGTQRYISKLVLYNDNSYYSLPTAFTRRDSPIVSVPKVLDAENPNNNLDLYFFVSGQEKHWGERSGHIFPTGIPNGKYYCFVEYYGMMGGVNRKIYFDYTGRMWMGYIRSQTVQIEYDSSKGKRGIEVIDPNVVLK